MLNKSLRLLCTLALAAAAGVFAQDYPNKQLVIVVPFAAGGPTDTLARNLGVTLTNSLKQQVIIDNAGGAGGTIGINKVAKARNDGYTLLLMHIGMSTSPALYRKLPYDTMNDFEFIGQVADVRQQIAESHVVMHPALGGEGLPRVLLEGAACCRPLIATDVSGNSDIVVDNENGLLIPPSDVLALANAMEWMMAHPEDRARMGAAGRERVLRDFASVHIATGYTGIYRELCPAAFPGTTSPQ